MIAVWACSLGLALGLSLIVAGSLRWGPIHVRRPSRSVVLAVLLGPAVWWWTGWPVASAAVVLAALVGPRVLRSGARQRIALREALADWTQRLAATLASGTGGLTDAIARTSRTGPAVIAGPLANLNHRIGSGAVEPALRAFADELDDFAVDAVVASLILRARDGGRGLGAVLEGWSASLRADVRAQREVEVERSKPRAQMKIVLCIVGTVLVVLLTMSRRFLVAFDSVTGQLWLGVVFALWFGAFWLAHYLTRDRRTPRLLTVEGRAA